MRQAYLEPSFLALPARGALAAALRSASRRPLGDEAPPVHLIEFDADSFTPAAFADAAIVYPDSIARSVRKRQAEFLFGRLAARLALEDLRVPAATEIGIGAAREPLWPDGIAGSISHSGRYAAATAMRLGRHRGIGVDIEQVIGTQAREALLATALDAAEAEMLDALACPRWSSNALLTAVFSAKESLFKGAFGAVGRFFDFGAARWTGWERGSGRLHLTLTETLAAEFQRGHVCDIVVARLDAETVLTRFLW